MNVRKWTVLLVSGITALVTVTASAALESEEDKTLYALGVFLAQRLTAFELAEDELAIVQQGFEDGALGQDPEVDLQAYGPKINEFAQARAARTAQKESSASDAFLAEAAEADGAERTESGLIYKELTAGSGASPAAEDTVKVHYHGTLRDGTVFDSSVDRGEPASFALNRVIPCWTEGVQKMKVGGKSKLVCPSGIAYGDRGSPPVIQPGAALVFEVELIEIQ